MTFNQIIIQILNAEPLDPNLVNSWLGLDPWHAMDFMQSRDTSFIQTRQIQEMGFESFDPISNLGGIFVLILIYVF